MKYCRSASPHIAHVQLSQDESRLEWVSKNSKTKGFAVKSIQDVVQGHTTAVFQKYKKKAHSERYRQEARKANFGTRPGQQKGQITDTY